MEQIEKDGSRRVVQHDGNGGVRRELIGEVSIGDLLKRMTSDASLLVRQEISLAKAEMRESVKEVQDLAVKLAIAAALAIPGALALTAFLVIALGEAMNSYWASALIVGVVLLGVAIVVARQGLAKVSDAGIGIQRTAASLAEDVRFGKEELRAFRRELTA
jgi:uncharacterized membrane protein YqjE